MSVLSEAVREIAGTSRLVFANPNLRRVNLALAGSLIGDCAFLTAISVYAYDWGGPSAVGIFMAIRLAVVAVCLPFLAALADRLPRVRLMVALDSIRAVLIGLATVLIVLEVPAPVVLVLAGVSSLVGSPFRPAQAGLLPTLAENPTDLTATNAVSSTLEGLAYFVGPALAGVLLGFSSVPVVFGVQVISFCWSALLLSRIRPTARPAPSTEAEDGTDDAGSNDDSVLAGFRTIGRSRTLVLVSLLLVAQTLVAGAGTVFIVAIAFDIVRLGNAGLGYLDAICGVGAVLGGFVALSRATRNSVARDFGVGVLGWALPLLLISLWPSPVTAFVALALIGLANPLVDVNQATLLQRVVPDAVLSRVFGAIESAAIAGMALGSLLMPLLIHQLGLRWALVAVAVPVAVFALATFGLLARLDRTAIPPANLVFLRSLPLFRGLSPAKLELLARRLEPVAVPAGQTVITEGQAGDRYYLIDAGRFRAEREGRPLRTMVSGEQFGEIALLRDVPRTASVVAETDGRLFALDRHTFIDVITRDTDSAREVEAIAAVRVRV